jgi:1-acyl-sn-glycerol-3-phosphate acyltransferase
MTGPAGLIENVFAGAVIVFARLVTGVRGNWQGCMPEARPRIYFANHASHGDFVLIWTVLPRAIRSRARPVAAADYWLKGRLRRFVVERVFRAVLIDRHAVALESDPIGRMVAALDGGGSLIFFPEGTRNTTAERLLPFKSGLYHLARARPDVELVPVWIENLNRVMPKGELVPIPLLCTVTFGSPLALANGEAKAEFNQRSHAALLALAPGKDRDG